MSSKPLCVPALLAFALPALGSIVVPSNITTRAVFVFDSSGAYQSRLDAGHNVEGTPLGVAIGPDGNVYVLDDLLAGANVLRYTLDGAYLGIFASLSSGDIGENLAFGPNGNLFVGDYTASSVVQYNAGSGVFTTFASGISYARGFDWDPSGNFWVVSSGAQQVMEFDSSGNLLGSVGAGVLSNPVGLAVDPASGLVYVADAGANQIDIFGPGAPGPISLTASPVGLKFGPDGALYVSTHPPGTGANPAHAILRYNGVGFDTVVASGAGGLTFPYYFDFAVPEPSTPALSLAGLVVLCCCLKGRWRGSAPARVKS